MNRISKRILSLVLALLLAASLSGGVFAAGSISPETGTQTVYMTGESSSVYISLANGSKSFTIKRSDVKVTPGGTGAKLVGFGKNVFAGEDDYSGSGKWESYSHYSYECNLMVNKTGTAKVTYKIGSKSYKTSVKVLAYKNPVKSITLTGVNGGKSFAAKTKSTAFVNSLPLKSTTKNAKLKITPASGWKITSVSLRDSNTDTERSIGNYNKGLSSATLSWLTLSNAYNYSVNVTFRNTSTGGTIHVHYEIDGAKA